MPKMVKVEFVKTVVPLVDDELRGIPLIQAIAENNIGKHHALRKMYIKLPSPRNDGILWLVFWSEQHQQYVDVNIPILLVEYKATIDEAESIVEHYAQVAVSIFDYRVAAGSYWG